ncbi:hypothetical protein ABZ890_45620 [Streptomyces sp. NPDC046984]|uniref:hypothetical protein n=1 Tax=Streptomyces sp. NPDC046984 TaxID=3155138 RepID=UPI0033D2AA37
MPERTEQPPEQPSPALPETTYTRRALTVMADEMERISNRRRLLTEVGLRLAFTAAIGTLPEEMADHIGDQVTALLPDTGPVITHGSYARLLRQTTESLELVPVDEDPAAPASALQTRAAVDYAEAQGRRALLSNEDRVHGMEPGGDH